MRFLKTFFRFCTITILCTTFTTVVWGYATETNTASPGTCSAKTSSAACNAVEGCAWWPNKKECKDSDCNNGVEPDCNAIAGCVWETGDGDGNACEVCSGGTYCVDDYGYNKTAKPCTAGYYCPAGTGVEIQCSAGTYSTGGASSCTTCTGSGTYCPAGATSPQACSAGYYCPNTTTRTACPAGTYNSKTAQSSSSACITCPDGTFSESSGRTTVCPQCPAGYYCPDTKTKYNCPINSFCPAGSTEYSACYNNTNGKFPETTGTNKTSVSDCCKTITAGKYYRTDTETIYNCESGYYCIGATVCYGSTTSYAGRSTCPEDQVHGRTVYSAGKTQETGATQNTDCYVHCDRKEIPGGYYDETNIYYGITQQARPPLPALYGYKACPNDDVSSFPTCYTGYSPNTEILKNCKANIYKISYNLNSGTSGGKQPATATYDSEFEVSNPTRSGYTFTGWKITGMNSGITHTYGNSTTTGTTISSTLETKFKNLHSEQDATVTFAAQWQIITYTITYELNSGTNNSSNPSSYNVETATITLANPTRTGYTFGGWYTTSNFSGSAVTQIAKGSTGNKTFYAKWTANIYKISYNLNSGTSGGKQPATATYDSEFEVSNPTRSGYTFTGWKITGMNSGITHTYGNSTTTGTTISSTLETKFKNLHSEQDATVTFAAQWQIITYTITYELNSGTNNSSNPSSYNAETATITLANPTRTGYTFSGWYTTSNFSGSAVTQIAKGSTGNKTFYAKWTANTYTVAYDANGGTGTMDNQSRTYNDGAKLTANTFTREGYTFAGWNTKTDGTGTSYANQATGNLTSTNGATVTLYAQWNMCQDNYYCSGDKETECPELFIYKKTDNNNIPATTINNCYLDPDLKLKDKFNPTVGIELNTLIQQGDKIFYKGNGNNQ